MYCRNFSKVEFQKLADRLGSENETLQLQVDSAAVFYHLYVTEMNYTV